MHLESQVSCSSHDIGLLYILFRGPNSIVEWKIPDGNNSRGVHGGYRSKFRRGSTAGSPPREQVGDYGYEQFLTTPGTFCWSISLIRLS